MKGSKWFLTTDQLHTLWFSILKDIWMGREKGEVGITKPWEQGNGHPRMDCFTTCWQVQNKQKEGGSPCNTEVPYGICHRQCSKWAWSGSCSTGCCEILGLGGSRAAAKHGLTPIFHPLPSIHHAPYSQRIFVLDDYWQVSMLSRAGLSIATVKIKPATTRYLYYCYLFVVFRMSRLWAQ